MGWGTTFNTEIYLNRKVFKTPYELQDTIEELKKDIENYWGQLKGLALATPKDISNGESTEEILNDITHTIDYLKEYIEDSYRVLQNLKEFQEHLKETGNNIMDYYPFKNSEDGI
jgi:hypothetical protein